MIQLHRRAFVRSSIAGIGAAIAAGGVPLSRTWADDRDDKTNAEDEARPDSTFLTWWTDPTTTMVIQWIAPEATSLSLEYSLLKADDWQTAKITVKDYPDTDLKVHRCELADLTPGSEYAFRLSETSSVRRFRTMPAKATEIIQFV